MAKDIEYTVTEQASKGGIYVGVSGSDGSKSLKKYDAKKAREVVRSYVGDDPEVSNKGSRRISRRRKAKAKPATKLNQM